MKKLLMAAVLVGMGMFGMVSIANANNFPVYEIQSTQVRDLSFKDIMRALYAGKMVNTYIEDEELSQMPHIGLNETLESGESLVAFMHPVLEYQNTNGESRYLVAIEKIAFYEDGAMVSCHVCSAPVDLYVFKQSSSDIYQLVSRTPKNYEGIGGSWGRSYFNVEEIQQSIQPIGTGLMGAFLQVGYCSTGTCESAWTALHLPESEFIGSYYVGDAGSDSIGWYGEESPLAFDYESVPTVVDNGAQYYPIHLHFTGDMPTDEDMQNIQYVDFVQERLFNRIAKEYQ